MDEQARELRARAKSAGLGGVPYERASGPGVARLARTVAVASGKGGVGKSTLALGIAMAAAERGVRTVLVDADLGMANLDIMAGVRPPHSAAEWLGGRVTLAECFVAVAPRLWLLGGASGLARMADLSPAQRQRLVEGLSHVAAHVDLMVLDLGAGVGAGTLELAVAADRVLMVTTPEPTALADAYGFMKACVRGGRRAGWNVACSMAVDADDGARAVERLRRAAAKHLGIDVHAAGAVPEDPAARRAVRAARPLLAAEPSAPSARAIRRIEGTLAGLPEPSARPDLFTALAARLGVRVAGALAAAVGGAAVTGASMPR
jgi:flagellar biosynthesis protein FlhG